MAFDWNFNKIKQQALAKYDKQYWGNVHSTYSSMGGRINWDKNTGTASYNAPNIPLPSLPEMWGQYQKGAKSRGAVADFMTFKTYYDQLKQVKRQQLVNSLTQAQLSGIPMDKIHDAIDNHPGLRDELLKTLSSTADENQRAALSSFVPPLEKTWGQTLTPTTLAALGATGMGLYGFSQGMIDDTPEGIADRTRRAQFAQRQKLKDYISNNPRPIKGEGTGIRKNESQAAYKKRLDKWKAGRPKPTVDQKITRGESWKRRFSKTGTTQSSWLKGAGATFAPSAVGMLAEKAGLSDADASSAEALTATGISGVYGTSAWAKGQAALKAAGSPKGKGAIMKVLKNAGIGGKIAMAILMGWQAYQAWGQSSLSGGSGTSTPTQTTKKKYKPVI